MFLTYDASRIDGFEGQVKLAMPKYRDRLQMISQCNFKVNENGEIAGGMENLNSLIKMIDFVSKAAKEIHITHKESGVTVKTFDELEENSSFDVVISDLAGFYMNAGKVGNS